MGKTLFIENARKLRYEAGWVAVHRNGDPRPVLLRADELDCIVVDGKAAFISTYLLDELGAKGYLNQVGIHHHSKTNPYNLACDLMEPFRPLIDRKVELERPRELTTSVKRLLASTLADRIPYGHGSYRVSDAIDLWVDGCLRVMEGVGDADGISVPGMP